MSELMHDKLEMEERTVLEPEEVHMACVLLLDTSASMSRDYIDSINKAIMDYIEVISQNEWAKKGLEVALIEFNDNVRVVQSFTPIIQFQSVSISTECCTACSAIVDGIELAIHKLEERVELYTHIGTPWIKPWIFMITAGNLIYDISSVKKRIIDLESQNRLKFFVVGTPGCDVSIIKSLTSYGYELTVENFVHMFDWVLSSGIATEAMSLPGEVPPLPDLPNGVKEMWDHWYDL